MTRPKLQALGVATVGVGLLVAAWAAARPQTLPGPPPGPAKAPDLQFKEEGDDLVVRHLIEGPAARQVVVADYTVNDGRAAWDEPPIGVEKPRRKPSVHLVATVLINRDLPGFIDKGLMNVPTPHEERMRQRHEVTWRLVGFLKRDFKKEDATWTVEERRLSLYSSQWREALPKLQKTIDEADARRKAGGAP
jgi:hypothetical protein